jgi:DNA ligase-1
MTRALAQHAEVEENALTHRLMGNWRAETTTYEELIESSNPADQLSKPYPFYLAYAVEGEVQELGNVADWQAEWKWDGIRGQIIIRNNELFVWSRGEELVTDKFPEFQELLEALPNGTVLDGEIIPFKEGKPLNFATMQTRISRKNVSKAILKSAPIVMIAYDILELDGQDLRETPMEERRKLLVQLVKNQESEKLMLSQVLDLNSWEKLIEIRSTSRENNAEGLMLKRKDSTYKIGRKKGDWWKWKVDPLTIDAVMIYAMRGHGRRANLYTDYTFAVWDGEKLVPFAKAYSGLTDKEIKRVDAFVKKNTVDKFGPVRSVTPELVFEIAFEGIAKSSRHKSGVALRFPRIHRWREDKPAGEANTMEDLMKMLAEFG